MIFDAIDLCAGPGGWSEAMRMLKLAEVGIEWDAAACATRAAAGHVTVRADIATLATAPMRKKARGLIASPPCQAWSRAGKRLGLVDQPLVHQSVADLAAGRDTRAELLASCLDKRSLLAAEPMRWLYDLRPEWTAMEEVPDVLPLWQQYAEILRGWGYSVWTGILNSADFGVPQTRRRAILIASRVRAVTAPQPTHAEDADEATLFGSARARWVSMAEALGWGATDRPVPTVTAGGGKTGGAEPFPTQARAALERSRDAGSWTLRTSFGEPKGGSHEMDPETRPAHTVTGKTRSWVLKAGDRERGTERTADEPASTLVFGNHSNNGIEWALRNNTQANASRRSMDEPAGTLFFGARGNDVSWVAERPATTVAATDRIAKPGHRDREGGERQFEDSVRITVEEASVLQSFPADYPWRGTKTKRFEQIGNAIPVRLAAAVIGAATGLDWRSAVESEYAAEFAPTT